MSRLPDLPLQQTGRTLHARLHQTSKRGRLLSGSPVRQPSTLCMLLLALLLGACQSQTSDRRTAAEQSSSEVYEALIESPWFSEWFLCFAQALERDSFALEERALGSEALANAPLPAGWSSTAAWERFGQVANTPGVPISIPGMATFDAKTELEIFGTAATTPDRYSKWSDWPRFYQCFPRAAGVLGLSPVVLSPDGLEAVVYVQLIYGGTRIGGHGGFARLVRADGAWRVQDAVA